MLMEVLAPAGSVESFKAALLAGADAIYLGGKRFGARRFAENFTDAELRGAVALAHDRNVRVYVTVNTLVKQSELGEVLDYLDLLKRIDVDAVIVQDRGLVRLIRDEVKMPMHASTQMGIHTPEGVLWAKENGLDRVILSRELTLEEIGIIAGSADIGLEVFVHGALCYSFSGQCLFSSMVGGRSGNRGMCAQPCRKRYALGNDTGYLLSTADMYCADALPELARMGIAAVKIEGRMRSPAYVHFVTKAYKQAILRLENGEEPLMGERERELMLVAFNRGFSGGHMLGDDPMQKRHPESRGLLVGTGTVAGGQLSVPSSSVLTGDGITLYSEERKIGGFEVPSKRSDEGYRIPFPLPNGTYQVYKTRDREFEALDGSIRKLKLRPIPAERRHLKLDLPPVPRSPKRAEVAAYVSSLKTLEKALPFVDRVYFEWTERMDEACSMCKRAGAEFVPMLPRVSPRIPETNEERVMVCSIDQARRFEDRTVFGHYSMNLYNGLALPDMYQCCASVELARDELKSLTEHYPHRLEVLVFGRVELMVTKDPSIHQGTLVDERGAAFPVYRDRAEYAHILNSADLFLLDFLEEIEGLGVDSLGLDLRKKNAELAAMVAKAFQERDIKKKGAIKRKVGAITSGHYLRGVD